MQQSRTGTLATFNLHGCEHEYKQLHNVKSK